MWMHYNIIPRTSLSRNVVIACCVMSNSFKAKSECFERKISSQLQIRQIEFENTKNYNYFSNVEVSNYTYITGFLNVPGVIPTLFLLNCQCQLRKGVKLAAFIVAVAAKSS